jgi:hypothetical protein
MLVMAAHSVGRTQQAVRERGSPSEHPGPDDFLSGESGTVGGLDRARRSSADGLVGAWRLASGASARLDRAAQGAPQRRVLVVGVRRPQHAALAVAAEAELRRSRHEVDIHTCPPADKGKFENVNALLSAHPAHGHDWLLVIDDDVELGRRFLDRFIFLAERFGLDLAQPAHRANSHAAWRVTRRRLLSVVRETAFVEIGPVTAFRRTTFEAVLPFPDVPMGWGLDAHWAALARARGLRCGVVDAVAIGHASVPAGDGYSREAALAQARAFLATHPYLPARELQRTLATHRRW